MIGKRKAQAASRQAIKIAILISTLIFTACQTSETLGTAATEAGGGKAPGGRQGYFAPLKPFKDNLFSYRAPLQARDGGEYLVVPYDEQKDINQRDEMPVRKVRPIYTRRLAANRIKDTIYRGAAGDMPVWIAGNSGASATMTVIFLHGRDGNRDWGFDDERFGGNFNRAKNLLAEAGGVWLSPDFSGFEAPGVGDIAALIRERRPLTRGSLVLACGSLGTSICWEIMAQPETSAMVDGLVLLGGFPDPRFASSGVRKVPVYIAHGSRDPVYSRAQMDDFFIRLKSQGNPVRMTVFETGNHGTPVRMIDWRQALNWIAAKRP